MSDFLQSYWAELSTRASNAVGDRVKSCSIFIVGALIILFSVYFIEIGAMTVFLSVFLIICICIEKLLTAVAIQESHRLREDKATNTEYFYRIQHMLIRKKYSHFPFVVLSFCLRRSCQLLFHLVRLWLFTASDALLNRKRR